MKKWITAILAGLMLLSFSACSNNQTKKTESKEISVSSAETSNDDTQKSGSMVSDFVDTEKLDEKTQKYVTDVLQGDTLELSAEGDLALVAGLSAAINVDIAKDNGNIYVEMGCGEAKVKFIRNDQGTYLVDDHNKTAALQTNTEQSDGSENTESSMRDNPVVKMVISYFSKSFGLDSIEYKGQGKEQYNGQEWEFEKYTSDSGTIKAYYDGTTLKYIVSTPSNGKESVITVNKLTNKTESSKFEIPSDYQIEE